MKLSGTTRVQIENYLKRHEVEYRFVEPSVSSKQAGNYFLRTAIFVPDRNAVMNLSDNIRPAREKVFGGRGLRLYYFAYHTEGTEETVVKDHEL